MGSNKKHKSKKHKSHFVEEKVGGADGVKVVLRVPTTKDLTVKYPLEAIARARMETTQKRHKAEKVSHHHSKKKRKHHHEDSSNPNNALRAAGLEDISDDEGATYMEHTHSSKPEYGQDEDSSDLSLNVQIDLERLSLRKHKSPHNERSHSGKEFKKSVNPGATAFSVSPMSVVSHVPSPAEKKRKKKKKHKHSHYRHVDDNAPILHDSTSAGVACEMELMEPVTPPKLEFAPSSMELVDDVSMERAPSVHDEIKQGHEGFERGSCSSGKNINNAQSSQPISEDCVKSTGISPSSTTSSARNSVCFPRTALKFFLRHLLNQICRSDPERVFAEPVTDEIAPGYSKIIKNPMDCYTMRLKIENNEYLTVKEFKEDFILMCNNAMTYNSPETSYYQVAKNLLNVGMKMIQKELSVRPDLHHGLVSSFQPLTLSSSSYNLDYTSQFICSINLSALHQSHVTDDTSLIDVAGESSSDQYLDQSHLTQVHVGFAESPPSPITSVSFPSPLREDVHQETSDEAVATTEELEEEDILQHVDGVSKELKDSYGNQLPGELSFLSQDNNGKTSLNILNPYSCSLHPVNLNSLSDKVKAGQSASTVLNSELPIFKATPVSYLMYGPFGSFAPTYDTAFASLTKHDSSLLLSTYGSELGISYANSLQQFVRGCGTFASEMGDAILNSLTNGRHVKFLETLRQKDEQKKKLESEELSLNCKEDRFKDDKDDNIDRKNENTGDELLDSEYQDTNMTDQLPLDQSSGISVCLTRTTQLLEELDQQQSKRLGQLSVETYNKEFTLPQPSKNELETASQLTSELVTLVSQAKPGQLVSSTSLQQAMGGTYDKPN